MQKQSAPALREQPGTWSNRSHPKARPDTAKNTPVDPDSANETVTVITRELLDRLDDIMDRLDGLEQVQAATVGLVRETVVAVRADVRGDDDDSDNDFEMLPTFDWMADQLVAKEVDGLDVELEDLLLG